MLKDFPRNEKIARVQETRLETIESEAPSVMKMAESSPFLSALSSFLSITQFVTGLALKDRISQRDRDGPGLQADAYEGTEGRNLAFVVHCLFQIVSVNR